MFWRRLHYGTFSVGGLNFNQASCFSARPVFVMIVSQAFNAVILPATVACIFYLGNRKDLMGAYRNGRATNTILLFILLFSLFTSVVGIRGVWEMINS